MKTDCPKCKKEFECSGNELIINCPNCHVQLFGKGELQFECLGECGATLSAKFGASFVICPLCKTANGFKYPADGDLKKITIFKTNLN